MGISYSSEEKYIGGVLRLRTATWLCKVLVNQDGRRATFLITSRDKRISSPAPVGNGLILIPTLPN